MKKQITVSAVCLLAGLAMQAQSLSGAWEAALPGEGGAGIRCVMIIAEGYGAAAWYDAEGRFIETRGGKWALWGDTLAEIVEFDSKNPDRVGDTVRYTIRLAGDTLAVQGGPAFWRLDGGGPGALAGAWLISGRKQDGEIHARDTSGPRKTMKVLSGTRFQWIAYHTGTKEFLGSGGGAYTTENGKYTEHIEFFSRDDSRAGASLAFDFELIDGHWHHSGLSSRGQPIYEVWSLRQE